MSERRYRQAGVLAGLVVVTAALLAGLYLTAPSAHSRTPEQVVPEVAVLPVRWQSLTLPIRAEGIVQPARQIALIASVSGRVMDTDDAFRNGGLVEAGTRLLQLDPEPFELALARQRHDTSSASLHLAETRARARVARRTSGPDASPYALLQPHLAEAEARLAAANAALRNAELQLADTRIAAPFTGRLKDVAVQTGQYVNAGERLATLYTTESMEVRLPVRDRWLALLPADGEETAPRVTLRGDFGGTTRRWQGRIVRREGGLNENRMIYLVAQIDVAADEIPPEPGLLVQADIEGRTLSSVVRLPRSVLAGERQIWRLDSAQRLRRQSVTPLYEDSQWLYLPAELPEGTRIVLHGGLRWLEGSRVRPHTDALVQAGTP